MHSSPEGRMKIKLVNKLQLKKLVDQFTPYKIAFFLIGFVPDEISKNF